MNTIRWLLGSAVLLAAGPLLSGCGSLQQKNDQVLWRRSGETLHFWKMLPEASAEHLPYAWASLAAYQDDRRACADPQAFLRAQGWTPWDWLPLMQEQQPLLDPKLQDLARAMREEHLRVVVWSRPPTKERRGEVVVAFGGTVPRYLQDWKANFHWVGSLVGAKDQYDLITTGFAPAFVREFKARQAMPGWRWLENASIVPTGHSLGGGLAQRFAYEVWEQLKLPPGQPLAPEPDLRIPKILAFDPSPVSGKRSAIGFRSAERNGGTGYQGLEIYRVYNRGEILATLRSILATLRTIVHLGDGDFEKDEQGQHWIDIRYKDHWSWRTLLPDGWVHAHGLASLACLMAQATGDLVGSAAPGAGKAHP